MHKLWNFLKSGTMDSPPKRIERPKGALSKEATNLGFQKVASEDQLTKSVSEPTGLEPQVSCSDSLHPNSQIAQELQEDTKAPEGQARKTDICELDGGRDTHLLDQERQVAEEIEDNLLRYTQAKMNGETWDALDEQYGDFYHGYWVEQTELSDDAVSHLR